jgi:N-acetylmuramoyl-L-alanine amidase CwlA
MINIVKRTTTKNTTALANRKIEYIVLHYTAGTSSKKGKAEAIATYFATQNNASADFIVDDETIVQYNGDIENRYTWAVGGSKYTSLSTSQGGTFYKKCTNINSISIEMCSNKSTTKSLNATDTDWYFTDATINKAVELVKYLMDKYEIDINHVIMHHHVTGKICPNPWCVTEDRLTIWNNFKAKCAGTATSATTVSAATADSSYKVQVTANVLNVRKGAGTNYAVTAQIKDKGVYTIIETNGNWGKLKSGTGWICLDYTKRV